MTASSRINSHTELIRIDETRGNITAEEGDLLVNKKSIDQQTYAHRTFERGTNALIFCLLFKNYFQGLIIENFLTAVRRKSHTIET